MWWLFFYCQLWQLDLLRYTVLGSSEICKEISTKDCLKKNLPSSGVTGTIWKELGYNKVLGNINVYLYFLLANVSIPLLLLLYHPLLSPTPIVWPPNERYHWLFMNPSDIQCHVGSAELSQYLYWAATGFSASLPRTY